MQEQESASAAAITLDPRDIVLILGPPGSGKGTQSKRLALDLGTEVRSTGDLLRQEADPRLMEIMASGALVPEEEIQRILAEALKHLEGRPLILDGATRKPQEAEWLLGLLPTIGRRLLAVIVLKLEEEAGRDRIARGNRDRQDDHPECQDERWREFRDHTLQSIAIYDRVGLLEEINGNQDTDKVYRDVLAALHKRAGGR